VGRQMGAIFLLKRTSRLYERTKFQHFITVWFGSKVTQRSHCKPGPVQI
jgi:hypothetical protein